MLLRPLLSLQHCDLGLFKLGTGNNMTSPGVLYASIPQYRCEPLPYADLLVCDRLSGCLVVWLLQQV